MVNDSTREYSVYLSNEKSSYSGSGVLFYDGKGTFFVFTCAHVVKDMDKVYITVLKKDPKRHLYTPLKFEVPSSQIVIHPLEATTEGSDDETDKDDLAIIPIAKPNGVEIPITEYTIEERYNNSTIYIQGFPNGVPPKEHPYDYLESLHGKILSNREDNNLFFIRIDDPALDKGNRVNELNGLSGSPIWGDGEEGNAFLGLFTCTDRLAKLSRFKALKALRIRLAMRDLFRVVIKRDIEGAPKKETTDGCSVPVASGGSIWTGGESENEKWISKQLSELRFLIEDLKFQNAINKGKELVADPRYASLCRDSQRHVKQYLLYCYEIAYMDEEFEALEGDMRENGLIHEHDTLRYLTRSFMKRNFQDTINAAEHCISTWNGSANSSLLSIAKAFLLLAKAYTENLSFEETIGKLLDEQEHFVYPTDAIEDEALVYQNIGYVCGDRYHDYVKSIRFLNRSFQVGDDSMSLESMGASYYMLGIHDALDEKGMIGDRQKIDLKSLYKAREIFLTIREKSDELFWSGTIRRMGLCIFNTFVQLQDHYRIITTYQDIKKYLTVLSDAELRDVEMNYALVIAQQGDIVTYEYPHISIKDGILLDGIAKAHKCLNLIEENVANVPADEIRKLSGLAKEIRNTVHYLEDAVRRIDRKNRVPLYEYMINLYGYGTLLFGWDKKEKLDSLFERLSEYGDPDLLETMSNFIFEMNAPIEEAIKRFTESFQKQRTRNKWNQLVRFYIRHGMMYQADAMYKRLLSEDMDLVEDSPEYAYRAFIDYVTQYKRDLKYAIQCYLDAKDSFKDVDVEGFWELELLFSCCSFNHPERFEDERRHFVDKGLVTEESYHRVAFIAHLTNLNKEKAIEHHDYIKKTPHLLDPKTGMIVAKKEEIHFLNWIGEIYPDFPPPKDSMTESRAIEILNGFQNETWSRDIDNKQNNLFSVKRTIVIDAWGLYQLATRNELDDLSSLDSVYISHMTVIHLIHQLSLTNNLRIRILLDYLKMCDKIHIYSAGFRTQLRVRTTARYDELAAAVAVAEEKDCLMVCGDPAIDMSLINHFGYRIIRLDLFQKLINP